MFDFLVAHSKISLLRLYYSTSCFFRGILNIHKVQFKLMAMESLNTIKKENKNLQQNSIPFLGFRKFKILLTISQKVNDVLVFPKPSMMLN